MSVANQAVNPFAKQELQNVNQGVVAIEQERATAEAQGRMVIAKKFPRDEGEAFARVMDSCKRASLAASAIYAYPRGGQTVSGPSIRLAEELARCWGNIDFGIQELSQKEGYSEMMAYAWDMQTNTVSKQQFTVKHMRDKRGGGQALTDQRDIYEIAANMGARRLRARIMAILPPDLIEAAVEQCKLTMKGGNGEPIGDRIKKMIAAYDKIGVNAATLKKIIKKNLDEITADDLVEMTGIYHSLKDKQTKVADWTGEDKPDTATVADKVAKGEKKEPKQEKPSGTEQSEQKDQSTEDYFND